MRGSSVLRRQCLEGQGSISLRVHFRVDALTSAWQNSAPLPSRVGLRPKACVPLPLSILPSLQRSYDQVLHDVCIQNLPVIFALDRGGLVGADGPTHHGVFDFAFLRSIPNMVVMAPKDENELQSMVKTAVSYQEGPIAFRYPRGTGVGVKMAAEPQVLPIGKSEIVREGEDVLVIAIGNRVYPALEAAQTLADSGISAAVVNARFVKPLDTATILPLAERIGKVITIEGRRDHGRFRECCLGGTRGGGSQRRTRHKSRYSR